VEATTKKVVKTITINAPVAKVFGYLDEPTNLPEIWPSLIEARDVERLPNGGTAFKWIYKMAGMRLKGTSEATEYIPNRRTVFKSKGGVQSTIAWMLQPDADGTKVIFEAECTVPARLVGRLTETFIVKQNEREAELILANLKDRMEM
jgi:uncharacterized protein YndB with AHSA1/START domain